MATRNKVVAENKEAIAALTVKQQLDVVAAREKRAEQERTEAGNILALGNALGLMPTQVEEVLAKINVASGVMTEELTRDDLQHLAKAMDELQDKFKSMQVRGGIHPRTVINKSRKVDLQRCQDEINTAVMARRDKEGVVVFRVNASAKSKQTHHAVSVQFLDFQAALAGGRITNKMAEAVARGPIRFDCDCGRHRFWYRYVATVGGFAQGKAETGFPKVRNPKLGGLACKHVLRVMLVLTKSPSFIAYMKQYIEQIRGNPTPKAKTMGKKQIEKLAEKISQEAWNKKRIRQHANAAIPADMTDAFSSNSRKAKSIAGVGMTPAEIAKAKAQAKANNMEAIREINRQLNNPEIQRNTAPEVWAQIQKLLEGANRGS